MNITKTSNWNTLRSDCCTEAGITCDVTNRVTIVNWAWYGLNGTIDGTAIPSTLVRLTLNGNKITGSIPTFLNGIQGMNLDGNYLSGNLPVFPSSVVWIYLGWTAGPGNHLTGTLSLNRPTAFYINDNMISDVVITSTSLLTNCDLSNNPLQSNPRLPALSMCTQNGLYQPSAFVTPSTDCPNIINLAKGLNLDIQQPAIMLQLQNNCCDANGIICDENRKVKHIYWESMELNGFINGTAIPPTTIYIDLYANQITGSIPNGLPNNLYYLDLGDNEMSGDLPTFPGSLVTLLLSHYLTFGNHFTGTLRLNKPADVYISHSYVTDIYVNNYSLLNNCDLSYSPLLGNPRVALYTGCVTTGIYSASLLPNTLISSSTSKLQTITKAPSIIAQRTITLLTSIFAKLTLTTSTPIASLTSSKTTIAPTTPQNVAKITTATSLVIYTSSLQNILETTNVVQLSSTDSNVIVSSTYLQSVQTSTMDLNDPMILSYFSPPIITAPVSQFRYIMLGLRVLVTSVLLVIVLVQTPFTREIKRSLAGKTSSNRSSNVSSQQSKFNF